MQNVSPDDQVALTKALTALAGTDRSRHQSTHPGLATHELGGFQRAQRRRGITRRRNEKSGSRRGGEVTFRI